MRILSLDGGGVMGLLPLGLLRRIEEARPGFLCRADMLAGVSSGGIQALMIAAHSDPKLALGDAGALWNGIVPLYEAVGTRTLAAALGQAATYDSAPLLRYLEDVLGDRRLGDLRQRVYVGTVRIEAPRRSGPSASGGDSDRAPMTEVASAADVCGPRFFDSTDPDVAHVRVSDLAARTSAFPVLFPVHQGHVDGGLAANTPALTALSRHLGDSVRTAGGDRAALHRALAGTRVLSVGTGLSGAMLGSGRAEDWGYGAWMMRPGEPGLFTHLAVTAPMALAVETCAVLLGEPGFHRLNPAVGRRVSVGMAHGHGGPIDRLRDLAIDAAAEADLEPVLAWIDASGWMTEAPGECGPDVATLSPEGGRDAP